MVQSENSLIQAAQAGNVQAFNELVLAYQDRVFSLAYRLMGDSAAADDMAQESFIKAFRQLQHFTEGNFRAWLLRITTNTCYDELRRRQRRPATSLEDSELDEEADGRLISPEEGPEQQLQRGELRSAIENCLAGLSEAFRVVVVLADVEDYPYEEIAQMTGSQLGTVKSRLSRARMQLRDCLRGQGELLPAMFRSQE
jgi:RNA polymerase sigma-70 factor (ECF subfamily)